MKKTVTRCLSVYKRRSCMPMILLGFAGIAFTSVSHAAINIGVPNGDFSQAGNVDSKAPVAGVLLSYDDPFGSGPWSVDSNGILGLLLAPSVDIDQTNATVSGLSSGLNLGDLLNSSASIYQNDIGTDFIDGWTYTLTADVSVVGIASVDLLSDSGIGIALKTGGTTQYATDVAGAILNVGILSGETVSISYTYTYSGAADNAIGVDLYVGQGDGLASLDALGAVSFDNVTLTAVPEPGTSALLLGLLGLTFAGIRRARSAR
ncbi:PEP-CTERM sorting domain-containing protein [Coraliomargarita sp. SDUM461004]|uniref:PEP-CTERM sorting domain-containing protein n=1 Tax=Thalassobacterium sedimentorum TaxID=3041258 RepID=A0ABU1AJZ6_9BACT|nr:PEP-CTERM sorting domain-containing protein [Coraliomargarita sp. SDUM461004]MDQ8193928.1 PEP-CTERM sorting domain-containing protein [Coraliomargarita sp. SDUM461004]